jgi:glucose/arabinose dehydrogenase
MKRPRVQAVRYVVAAGAVALVASACFPPAAQPQLAPPPPDIGLPASSPTLTKNLTFITASSGTALANPWDVAFTPDGAKGLFTERGGRISQFDPATPGSATLVGTVPSVQQTGESGLLGLAIDPGFATNGFIYVCASRGTNEVLRLTADLTVAPGTGLGAPTVMLTGMPQNSFHDGCRLRFQPGTTPPALWVSMGDAGIGPGPQDLSSPAGKILRTRVDQGTLLEPYPGNPRANQAKPASLIYSIGHRNPQGLAFQPGTNQPYDTEHGPSVNDEVNRLVAGGNAGWDPNTNGSYDQSHPMTDLVKFPFAVRPAWRSGDSFTLAPSGATFIEDRGSADWKSWNGALAVAFLKDSKLRILFLDGNGNVTGAYPTLAGKRLRSVAEGPDGSLFVSTDAGSGSDAIYKVTPVP